MPVDTYYTWEMAPSIAYLNNRYEIDEILANFPIYDKNLQKLFTPPYDKNDTTSHENLKRPFIYKYISEPSGAFANCYNRITQFESINIDDMLALNHNKFKS